MWLVALCFAWMQAPASAAPSPDDDACERAWKTLSATERDEVVQRFQAEVEGAATLQRRLIEHALELGDTDPGLLDDAPPTPHFDPNEHAPGDPIPRKPIDRESTKAAAALDLVFGKRPRTTLVECWRYDWGTRAVVRLADPTAPAHVLGNALAGRAPGYDLALAFVAQALDGGEQQVALKALGHAYTDREGGVYPGITLYDAWSSGREIEMPDVDVLGVLHDVLDERDRWRAPIPGEQHDAVYRVAFAVLDDARRYRGLREALARCYLDGAPKLRDSYLGHVDRLNALWESVASSPRELAPTLPAAAGTPAFLAALPEKIYGDAKLVEQATARRQALADDARRVRELMIACLRDAGAFDRAPKAGGEGEEGDRR